MNQVNHLKVAIAISSGLLVGQITSAEAHQIAQAPAAIHKPQVVIKKEELKYEIKKPVVAASIETPEDVYKKFVKQIKNSNVIKFDLRKPSGLTVEMANKLLDGTLLAGLGKAFIDAEKKYKINAYYLISHAALESGWGTSRLAREKNNLFGFTAYDKNPSGAIGFKSKASCIDTVAKYISEHYLKEDGEHYNGPNLKGMNVKYASDKEWSVKIGDVMLGLVNKTEETVL